MSEVNGRNIFTEKMWEQIPYCKIEDVPENDVAELSSYMDRDWVYRVLIPRLGKPMTGFQLFKLIYMCADRVKGHSVIAMLEDYITARYIAFVRADGDGRLLIYLHTDKAETMVPWKTFEECMKAAGKMYGYYCLMDNPVTNLPTLDTDDRDNLFNTYGHNFNIKTKKHVHQYNPDEFEDVFYDDTEEGATAKELVDMIVDHHNKCNPDSRPITVKEEVSKDLEKPAPNTSEKPPVSTGSVYRQYVHVGLPETPGEGVTYVNKNISDAATINSMINLFRTRPKDTYDLDKDDITDLVRLFIRDSTAILESSLNGAKQVREAWDFTHNVNYVAIARDSNTQYFRLAPIRSPFANIADEKTRRAIENTNNIDILGYWEISGPRDKKEN